MDKYLMQRIVEDANMFDDYGDLFDAETANYIKDATHDQLIASLGANEDGCITIDPDSNEVLYPSDVERHKKLGYHIQRVYVRINEIGT
jgi:hypothetical protein